jgi:hypothetical protein
MKQHITIEMFEDIQLNDKLKLSKWWRPRAGDKCFYIYEDEDGELEKKITFWDTTPWDADDILEYQDKDNILKIVDNSDAFPLLSIGQMIEFLSRDEPYSFFFPDGSFEGEVDPSTLCDSLWEEVKKELEKK